MTTDLDLVLWTLEAEAAAEPNVLVDPALEAFCLMGTRMARGTIPPSANTGRVPLKAILAYLAQNEDSGEQNEDSGEGS